MDDFEEYKDTHDMEPVDPWEMEMETQANLLANVVGGHVEIWGSTADHSVRVVWIYAESEVDPVLLESMVP